MKRRGFLQQLGIGAAAAIAGIALASTTNASQLPKDKAPFKPQHAYPLVTRDICALCGECVEACPYGAFYMNEELGYVVLNKDKCKQCTPCYVIGFCPTDAINQPY